MTLEDYSKYSKANEILGDKTHFERIRNLLLDVKKNDEEFVLDFGKNTKGAFSLTTNPNAPLGNIIIETAVNILNEKIKQKEEEFS